MVLLPDAVLICGPRERERKRILYRQFMCVGNTLKTVSSISSKKKFLVNMRKVK